MCEKLFTGRARRSEPVPGPVSRSGPGSPLSSVCPYSAKSGRPGRAGDSRYSEFVQISHTLLCAEIGGNQNDEIGAGQGRDRLVAQAGPVRQPSDIDWRCYWPTVGAALAQFRSRILECENGWRQTKWTERFRFCSISGGLCLDAALSSCDSLDRGMLGAWGTHRAQALYAVSAQYRDTVSVELWLSPEQVSVTSFCSFSPFATKSANHTNPSVTLRGPTGLKGFPFLVKLGWS